MNNHKTIKSIEALIKNEIIDLFNKNLKVVVSYEEHFKSYEIRIEGSCLGKRTGLNYRIPKEFYTLGDEYNNMLHILKNMAQTLASYIIEEKFENCKEILKVGVIDEC